MNTTSPTSYFIFWLLNVNKRLLYLTLLGCVLTNSTWANTKSSIEIEADSAVIEENNLSHTYTGNVLLKQNNLLLRAEKLLVIFNDDKQVAELIASGQEKSKAYIKQQLESSSDEVEGWALKINYNLSKELIDMTGDVLLIQNNNQIKGHTLTYDLVSESIDANAQRKEGERVQMVIQP